VQAVLYGEHVIDNQGDELMVRVDEVRAALARARRTQASAYTALKWSHVKWQRRMNNPDTWTIGELKQVAAELGIPVRQLLALGA
jgi:Holliday junction resolvase